VETADPLPMRCCRYLYKVQISNSVSRNVVYIIFYIFAVNISQHKFSLSLELQETLCLHVILREIKCVEKVRPSRCVCRVFALYCVLYSSSGVSDVRSIGSGPSMRAVH
jgi:hypothetical protein